MIPGIERLFLTSFFVSVFCHHRAAGEAPDPHILAEGAQGQLAHGSKEIFAFLCKVMTPTGLFDRNLHHFDNVFLTPMSVHFPIKNLVKRHYMKQRSFLSF